MSVRLSIRKSIFWTIQAIGLLFIQAGASYWKLSFWSVWGGILLVYLNMEILFWVIRNFFSSFYLIVLKYLIFVLLIYFLKDYIDLLSFLLGLSSIFFYIVGLSVEAVRNDSL